jgi:hypothetical protein
MISEFPDFTPITIDICPEIKKFTDNFPPYSDFCGASLFCWNYTDEAKVTIINDNLAIYYPNYSGDNYILSFMGINKVSDTTASLLKVAGAKLTESRLDLVPEISILELTDKGFYKVVEAPDNHDYIISLSKLASPEIKDLTHFRRGIKTFRDLSETGVKVNLLDLSNKKVIESIIGVFNQREFIKETDGSDNELIAIRRLLDNNKHFNLLCYGLEIENEIRAFIICENIGNSWCMGHFWKADTRYRGIYSYLMWQTAIKLRNQGINFMNIEQDLGIKGLRQFKKSLCPISNLKKYIIKPA